MKVFFTLAYAGWSGDNIIIDYLHEAAATDTFKIHKIAANPEDADIIIFPEMHPPSDPFFFRVLKNPVYIKYRDKCYLYHDNDISVTLVPTITPSVEASKFIAGFTLPFAYIYQFDANPYLRNHNSNSPKKYLYSFIGASRTHPIRAEVFKLNYEMSYLNDTSTKNSWELTANQKDDYYKTYADICFQSKFILCPRGIGPSTYRLYESLEMGIAPVIICDEWLAPEGPDWATFTIQVAEADIDKIPEILKQREHEAEKMGLLAREAWLNWFAKDKQFHLLTEACIKLHNSRSKLNFGTYLILCKQFLTPYHFKNLLRYYKNRLKFLKIFK